MEQLNFNMLFRWFVGLGLDDGVWDASAFCHNRDRLLEAEVSGQLLAGVIGRFVRTITIGKHPAKGYVSTAVSSAICHSQD